MKLKEDILTLIQDLKKKQATSIEGIAARHVLNELEKEIQAMKPEKHEINRKSSQQVDETPTMKIYIARDAATFEDEDQERFVGRHPEKETEYGRLRLFYEKPEINKRTGVWEGARTAGELKGYMFPEIRCKECMEFTGPSNIPEHLHYPGALHVNENNNQK